MKVPIKFCNYLPGFTALIRTRMAGMRERTITTNSENILVME